ncbi:MAG: hypothetical protein K0U47_00775 [Epsilonproteobacteria bacterium]|nr:hypothetical protein [Campylobacterota bacterium]
MRVLLPLLFATLLWGEKWSMVIDRSCEPPKQEMLQNIYLKKQRFSGTCRLVPLNLSAKNPMRAYVMNSILKMSHTSWNYYYNEMHFKGVDPPKTVDSPEAMLKYLLRIKGAIGYIPSHLVDDRFYVVLEFSL